MRVLRAHVHRSIPLDNGLHRFAIGGDVGATAVGHVYHALVLRTKSDERVGAGAAVLAALYHCTHKLPALAEPQCVVATLELWNGGNGIAGVLHLAIDAAKIAAPHILGLGGASGNTVHIYTCVMVMICLERSR